MHRFKTFDLNFINLIMSNTINQATIYTHNKSGKHYILLNNNIIECTNGREEKKYALYANLEGQIFCRKFAEFIKKFTRM